MNSLNIYGAPFWPNVGCFKLRPGPLRLPGRTADQSDFFQNRVKHNDFTCVCIKHMKTKCFVHGFRPESDLQKSRFQKKTVFRLRETIVFLAVAVVVAVAVAVVVAVAVAVAVAVPAAVGVAVAVAVAIVVAVAVGPKTSIKINDFDSFSNLIEI